MEINYPSGENAPKIPPLKFGPWMIPVVVVFLAFAAAGTIFYQVGPDEVGVVQRFGRYVRTTQPGLRIKIPFGVETAKNVKVTHVFKEEFGFRTVGIGGGRSTYAGRQGAGYDSRRTALQQRMIAGSGQPFLEESLMLTGDLNVAVVEWIVQYTIKDPRSE